MPSPSNPVNQQRAIKKINRDLSIRLERAQRKIKIMLRSVPRKTRVIVDIQNGLTVNLAVTSYETTQADIEALQIEIEHILNQELLDNPTGVFMPVNWYYKEDIEQPYRAGVAEEVNETNHLIEAAIIAGLYKSRIVPRTLSVQEVLLSQQYRDALGKVYAKNYGYIKTLASRTAAQVYAVINEGMSAKKNVTTISGEITERFDVAKSSAQRTAVTGANRAFNDGKLNAGELITNETGVKTAVRHMSSLISTTRSWHAARHQKIYTREAQERWWDEGSNRLNCYCYVKTVLLDGNNKISPVSELKRTEEEQGKRPKVVKPTKKKKPVVKRKKTTPKKTVTKRKIVTPVTPVPSSVDAVKKAKTLNPTDKPKEVYKKKPKKQKIEPSKLAPKNTDIPTVSKNKKLTPRQEESLVYYKGEGFYKNNKVLRNRELYDTNDISSAEKMLKDMNDGINKSTFKSDGQLYRGIKSSDLFENAENLIGKKIGIQTPQSASTQKYIAQTWSGIVGGQKGGYHSYSKESVFFKINVKKGQHGFNMESIEGVGATGEAEILLGSNSHYKVKSVRNLLGNGKDKSVVARIIEVDYIED